MPTYVYKAVTQNGDVVRNRVEDISRMNLIKKLKRNNLLPITVIQTAMRSKARKKGKRNTQGVSDILKGMDADKMISNRMNTRQVNWKDKINLVLSRTQKITTRDILIFTENFYLLKKANFNNIHALATIIENTENLLFREVLEDILAGVEAGENIYTTMEYYVGIFPYIYINMVKIGELSGSLTKSLQQAIEYLEDTSSLNKKLKNILIPNIIQTVVLLIMLIGGSLIAIPTIQDVFDSVGTQQKLPPLTIAFTNFINVLVAYWYIPVGIIVLVVGAILFYVNTPKGRYNFHYFKYTAPIFGKLIYAIDFSRFMRAVLLNVQNGMRIQDALEVSKNVVQNLVLLSMIETSMNNILIGKSWIDPFEKSGLSSSMITEMLKIGMQTDLAVMLEKLLEYMEMDIDTIMEKIMKVLPQLVYIIVGVLIIFFVLVILVPLIQVYMGTFLFSAYGY